MALKSALTSVLSETLVLTASHTLTARSFEKFWASVSPKLTDGVSYMEKTDLESLTPQKSFFELVTLRDAKMARIVNSCLEEFLSSDILALIDAVQKLQDRINSRKAKINAWRLGLISAPASSLNPLRATRAKLYKRIKKEQSAIGHDEQLIGVLKTQSLEKFAKDGVPISAEQLDGLLYMAEGSDIARVMAVAQNIQRIEEKLSNNLKAESSSSEVKTYTGFLMLSYRVYLEAVDRALNAIDNAYLVRLEKLFDQANTEILRAKALYDESKKTNQIAKNNLELNARSVELINRYRDHLNARAKELKRLHKEMFLTYEVAVNTFRTVKVGSELIEIIRAGEKDLASIFDFKPPQINLALDEAMKTEFETLTQRLKGQ